MDGAGGVGLNSVTDADLRVPVRFVRGALRGVPRHVREAVTAVPEVQIRRRDPADVVDQHGMASERRQLAPHVELLGLNGHFCSLSDEVL